MEVREKMEKQRRALSIAALAGVCLGFLGTTFGVVTYMAKDYNAYNLVYSFFGISADLRMNLEQLALSKLELLRVINLSHMLFVSAGMMYALLFTDLLHRRASRWVWGLVGGIAVAQMVLMDPGVVKWFYMKGIGPFENIIFFRGFYAALSVALRWYSIIGIGLGILLLTISFFQTPRFVRASAGLLTLFLAGLSLIYLYLYGWLPRQIMWMSRVARYVRFDSLPLNEPTALNVFAPALSLLFVLSLCASTIHHLRRLSNARRRNLAFRSKVSATETATRIFCHYLKNELLAQQAELRLLMMRLEEPLKADLAFVISRNDEIYQRLGAVQDTMKQRKIALEPMCLTALLRDTLDQFERREGVTVEQRLPRMNVWVQGNPYQLGEVFDCILKNALEALEHTQANPRLLLSAEPLRRYMMVTISNNGPRIPREQWEQVFDPFFTTKSANRNWGLGLALCKNIVTLHHGRIWVDEQSCDGEIRTSFHVLLSTSREPSITK